MRAVTGPTPSGDRRDGRPAGRPGAALPTWDPGAMFNDLLEVKAVEARGHLLKLEAERALAVGSRVAEIDAYMADLELEIDAPRRLYSAAAVTEIATLRAELSGAEVG